MMSTTKHQNDPTILQLPGDGSLRIHNNQQSKEESKVASRCETIGPVHYLSYMLFGTYINRSPETCLPGRHPSPVNLKLPHALLVPLTPDVVHADVDRSTMPLWLSAKHNLGTQIPMTWWRQQYCTVVYKLSARHEIPILGNPEASCRYCAMQRQRRTCFYVSAPSTTSCRLLVVHH